MKLTSKPFSILVVSGLFFIGALPSRAADLLYNFSFELTSGLGSDLYTDGSFLVDPTLAATGHGTSSLGETYATTVDSLAFTVFDFSSAQNVGTVNFGKSNLQNAGFVYFTSLNPSSGLADPIFTLSAPDATGFLTLVLNGTTDSFYQSSTLGGTTGTPLATGMGQLAQTLDATAVPEPGSLTLLSLAGVLLAGGFFLRRRHQSAV